MKAIVKYHRLYGLSRFAIAIALTFASLSTESFGQGSPFITGSRYVCPMSPYTYTVTSEEDFDPALTVWYTNNGGGLSLAGNGVNLTNKEFTEDVDLTAMIYKGSTNVATYTIPIITTFAPFTIMAPSYVCAGTGVTVSITSTNPTIARSWEYYPDQNNQWASWSTSIASSQTRSISVDANFRIRATDCPTPVYSNVVTTYVYPTQTAGSIVPSSTTVTAGNSPGTIANNGSNPPNGQTSSYQWQMSTDGGNNWAIITGATGSSYTPGNLFYTTQFRRGVSGCGQTAYTNAVLVTVTAPTSHTIPSEGTYYVCPGQPNTFTFWDDVVFNPELTQWTTSDGQSAGGYQAIFSFNDDATIDYHAYKINAAQQTVSVESGSVTIHVHHAGVSSPTNVCAGTAISLTNTGTMFPGLALSWQKSPAGTNSWSEISQSIAGSITYTPSVSTDFRMVMTSCASNNISSTVTTNVFPTQTAGTIGGIPTLICTDSSPGTITDVTAPAGQNASFQWESSTDGTNFSPILLATTQSYPVPSLYKKTWYQRKVTGCLQTMTSNAIAVDINKRTAIVIPDKLQVCSSGTVQLSPLAVAGNTVTSWWARSYESGTGYTSWSNFSTANSNVTFTVSAGSYKNRTYEFYFILQSPACGTLSALPVSVEVFFSCDNVVVANSVLVSGVTDASTIPGLPVGQVATNLAYVDGLGRTLQTISKQGSPGKLDVVGPVVYDAFGRESRSFLPFAAGQTGAYQPNSQIIDASGNYTGTAQTFYSASGDKITNDSQPYAQKVYEPSPLNRVIKQGGPGTAWQPDSNNSYGSTDHTVKFSYESNNPGEVYLFLYNPVNGLVTVSPNNGGYYLAAQLQMKKTKDEKGDEVIEYVDKLGHVICKKVQYDTLAGVKKYAETYYIYDNLDNLVVVLPPEGVKAFFSQN